MTDLARQALTKLPKLASNIKDATKQTFTLDMNVLDDAMDDEHMMLSIVDREKFLNNAWNIELDLHIKQNLDCDHLKELIIKNFKEFIDKKIFHSHFHSRNRKTKDTNSLSVFYRHGISKIISKMVDDVKNTGNENMKTFFNNEIIKVMEKLEFETFREILQDDFGNTVQVESKLSTVKQPPQKLDFISNIIDDNAEATFLESSIITQDMKEELFYYLFKEDFTIIVEHLKQSPINLKNTGFEKIEELQDFYDKIEFKQQEKIERKQNEELQNARQNGIFSVFTKKDKDPENVTVKTEVPKPKKNKTTYITEDSNFI